MLTPELVSELQVRCSNVAHSNYDGEVTITQDENGVLTIVGLNEDEQEESRITATPCGSFEGHNLYRLIEDGDERGVSSVICTLIPVLIVGFMSL